MVFSITAYHTCREEGSADELRERVPFISRPDNQWLGKGYYFWTDSDYWAKLWMAGRPTVVSKFSISIPKIKVLDLVGNVSHQVLFKDICETISKHKETKELYRRSYGEELTVGTMLSWLRDYNKGKEDDSFFPFWAVKATDKRSVSSIKFSPSTEKKIFLVEPHQMCVYEEYKDQSFRFENFVHPQHFC